VKESLTVAVNGSGAAAKEQDARPAPRAPSNARLGEDGGTRAQLLARCATKAAALGAIVFLLTSPRVALPRLAQELLYGARGRPAGRAAPPPPSVVAKGLLGQRCACASAPLDTHIVRGVLVLRRAILQSGLGQPACGGLRMPDACCVPCVAPAFGLYAFLGFLMDGPASLATGMIGLQIAPQCAPGAPGAAPTPRCLHVWAAGRCSRVGRRL